MILASCKSSRCNFYALCQLYAFWYDTDFSDQSCGHNVHQNSCESCKNLQSLLSLFENGVNEKSTCLMQEYLVEEACNNIREWQAHIVRSVNQHQAQIDVLETLQENVSVVLCISNITIHIANWPSKFLIRCKTIIVTVGPPNF